MSPKHQHHLPGNAPGKQHVLPHEQLAGGAFDLVIHGALTELSQHRRLTPAEVRLRCIVQPRPWRDAGCDRSTWFRRRARAQRSASTAEAMQ